MPVLLEAFRTYHTPMVVSTLHVLGSVIPLGLPGFQGLLRKFLGKLFKLFESSGTGDLDFINSLFKCTAELIRSYATFQDLSQPQLKTLTTILKQHVNSQAQGPAFQCLRALVYRKYLCAELYDLIETVQDLMVTSVARSTRQLCAGIFTQFLLEYPLEPSRVEQHINHIIKNLGYFDSEGRTQLLEVLGSLTERFPRELLDQYAELLFFSLVLRTVNEGNAKCREKVASVIKRLVLRCSPAKAKTLFNTVLQMESERKQAQLAQAKHTILGLFIETLPLKAADTQRVFEQCLKAV